MFHGFLNTFKLEPTKSGIKTSAAVITCVPEVSYVELAMTNLLLTKLNSLAISWYLLAEVDDYEPSPIVNILSNNLATVKCLNSVDIKAVVVR